MTTVRCTLLMVLSAVVASSQASQGTMSFTVSMERPSTHYYHVEFRVEGLKGDTQDLKMPVWMPGYYSIQDYAKNVVNFKVVDGAGRDLPWSQTAKNTWHVKTGKAAAFVASYDVYGFVRFVGSTYLDDQRGYFVAPSMYMHVAGMINHPVTVTIKPYGNWTTVANGLDPVPGKPNTFSAPDFDLLYDCPTMLGNHESYQFDVKGVPHYAIAEDVPKSVDRKQMVADLQKIVTTATDLIGEVPYKHYTFLLMGKGAGGVEHLTSAAMLFDGTSLTNPDGYRRWLGFAAHEYFHTFNVKRIRPLALGPFDYDKENFTDMLWVSEGFTSYYQDIILRRAGLTTRQQYFDGLTQNISTYENSPGHLFESAAQSSINVWHRGDNSANTTISYYNKGPAIAAMMDLKIRTETKNQKSLDDVMRSLYNEFYKTKKRGWTDEEFRATAERIAGVSLAEIFDDYAFSTKEVNYPKYFALGGLKIDTELRGQPGGAYLGALTGNAGGRGGGGGGRGAAPAGPASHVISRVEYDSPADRAGLSAQDEILAIDGIPIGARSLDDALKTMKSGDKVKILIARPARIQEVEVTLGSKMQRSFKIQQGDNLTQQQTELLQKWVSN